MFASTGEKWPDYKHIQFGKKPVTRSSCFEFSGVLMDEHLYWKFPKYKHKNSKFSPPAFNQFIEVKDGEESQKRSKT